MLYSFGACYDVGGNLADAYTNHCNLVPKDEDWIMLLDGDFMILTPEYGHVINQYIKKYPEYALWTIYTNRVMCKPQLVKELFYEGDIRKHREKALELYETKRYDVKPIVRSISGYCMIFQKKTFNRFKFRGKGVFGGTDTAFSLDVLRSGGKIGLMEAVYGFHYYRFNEGTKAVPYKDNATNEQLKKTSGYTKR
jgi:GT2 family glycosyltransferase